MEWFYGIEEPYKAPFLKIICLLYWISVCRSPKKLHTAPLNNSNSHYSTARKTLEQFKRFSILIYHLY